MKSTSEMACVTTCLEASASSSSLSPACSGGATSGISSTQRTGFSCAPSSTPTSPLRRTFGCASKMGSHSSENIGPLAARTRWLTRPTTHSLPATSS